jgi:cobalt/nickel transport protein
MITLVLGTTYLSLHTNFIGTDDQATEQIMALNKSYEPWFNSIFEPSDTFEVLIFILQGFVGSLILGFCLYAYSKRGQRA